MTKIIAAAFIAFATLALADGIYNPTIQGIGGVGGVSNPTVASAPPSSCDGTIDLSTGCVQPMLGGL